MNFVPTLRKIKVPIKRLLLDPNNPRFLEDHSERVDEKNFHESGVQIITSNRMSREAFQLTKLKNSILENGWQPVDMIFVRKIEDHFVVLEGNRRLMALRALGEEEKLVEPLKSAVDPLTVLEVVDQGNTWTSRGSRRLQRRRSRRRLSESPIVGVEECLIRGHDRAAPVILAAR